MKEKFRVTGMTCSACSSRVEKTVSKLEGTETVSVNLLTGTMQVTFDESKLNDEKIITAVEKAGYGAYVDSGQPARRQAARAVRAELAQAGRAEMEMPARQQLP